MWNSTVIIKYYPYHLHSYLCVFILSLTQAQKKRNVEKTSGKTIKPTTIHKMAMPTVPTYIACGLSSDAEVLLRMKLDNVFLGTDNFWTISCILVCSSCGFRVQLVWGQLQKQVSTVVLVSKGWDVAFTDAVVLIVGTVVVVAIVVVVVVVVGVGIVVVVVGMGVVVTIKHVQCTCKKSGC